MSGILLLLLSSFCLVTAYVVYGGRLAKKWGIDPNKKTPAHELSDGVDYVAGKRSVVFGHQFASIAGAGPINGPIIAAMFGWLPVLLWILIGGIFIGAVQDFAAMYASVKNKGRTIGYVIEQYIGQTGKKLFLMFVWLFSILVIAAFADIVAQTFNGFSKSAEKIPENAAVATTSILFMIAAVGLGFFIRRKPNNILQTSTAIILLIACVAFGLLFPIFMTQGFWLYFVFGYVFIACITPVWALLQPRDYLNSFLLIAMMICAFAGVIIDNPKMNIAPFTGFEVNGNYLFPILFVTVACGAVSGFHALIASGTASKQIENERDILPVSFGAMLVECLLAVLALIAVGALAAGGKMPQGTPPVIFANAVSGFLSEFGLPQNIVYTLITLSISAFALTSLDSCARIGRLSFQEFFMNDEKQSLLVKILCNKYFATAITLVTGYLLALRGYQDIWPLFGSANQLLGALALIACAVFLKKTNRSGFALYIPFGFMLAVTFSALGISVFKLVGKIPTNFSFASDGIQLVFAVLLFALGVVVAVKGVIALNDKKTVIE
ncbi:MAG: carbon starvation protein A [Chitinispirillales bacterium]|jgi:carbon starvation protein|nr:carbon starvation protein A [Chitinispirillales bacterium]